jgi:hypothetical protein
MTHFGVILKNGRPLLALTTSAMLVAACYLAFLIALPEAVPTVYLTARPQTLIPFPTPFSFPSTLPPVRFVGNV